MKKHSNVSNGSHNHRDRSMVNGRSVGMVAAAVLLLLLLLWGFAKVADASTPKDMLFPIDHGFEKLRAAFTMSPQSRAHLALASFNERQHEAESLVVVSDFNGCDAQANPPQTSGNDEAIMKALNLSQTYLSKAEAETMQVTNASTKEELNANIVEIVGHHLQVWQSLSRFAPIQTHNAIAQVTDAMVISVNKALAALPEGRGNDLAAKLQFNLAVIGADIRAGLGACGESGLTDTNGTNGNGTGSGTGNGSGAGVTIRTTGSGSTGTNGTNGTSARPGTSGNNGSNGSNGSGNGGAGTNVNVNSDAGVNVDAGINGQGQLYVEPTINLNPNNGVNSEGSINDDVVVDTNACPGPVVLGVCLGN